MKVNNTILLGLELSITFLKDLIENQEDDDEDKYQFDSDLFFTYIRLKNELDTYHKIECMKENLHSMLY